MARKLKSAAVQGTEILRHLRSIHALTRVCCERVTKLTTAINALSLTRQERKTVSNPNQALQVAMKSLDLELQAARRRHAQPKPRAGRILVAVKRFKMVMAIVVLSAGGL